MNAESESFSFMACTSWIVFKGKTAPSGGSNTGMATFCFSSEFNILPCTLWVSFTSSRRVTDFTNMAPSMSSWLLTLEEALRTLGVVLGLQTFGVVLGLWTLGVVLEFRTLGVVLGLRTLGVVLGLQRIRAALEPLPLKVIFSLYPIAGLPNSGGGEGGNSSSSQVSASSSLERTWVLLDGLHSGKTYFSKQLKSWTHKRLFTSYLHICLGNNISNINNYALLKQWSWFWIVNTACKH